MASAKGKPASTAGDFFIVDNSDEQGKALKYVRRGWWVLPCGVRKKSPIIAHGSHAASNDEAQVRAWWSKWPDANVGVVRGIPSIAIGRSRGGNQHSLSEWADVATEKIGVRQMLLLLVSLAEIG